MFERKFEFSFPVELFPNLCARKRSKRSQRAPPTHPSALAVLSHHRILVKHGLIGLCPGLADWSMATGLSLW